MRRRLQLAMVVLALSAFVGGCGGGDDDDEGATATTAAAATSSTAPPTTEVQGLASVFKPVSGYEFVELPPAILDDMTSELTSDPEFNDVVEDVQARSVTQDDEGVGIVMAMRLDAKYAALPGVEQGIVDEFAETAVSTRTVSTSGGNITVATDADGTVFLVWVKGTLVIMVIGPDETSLLPVARGLVTANS
jgi:hypothetical protein